MQNIENFFHNSQCQFLMGAVTATQHPGTTLPELAFIGRSNVGKSSLINALLNKKNLARTSNTPGRTQQLNYFMVNDVFVLVDMPGYGYAKAKHTDVKQWEKFIADYFSFATQLQRVFVLLDSRRGILPIDLELLNFLELQQRKFQLLLTKIDLIKTTEVETLCQELLQKYLPAYQYGEQEILAVSSSKKIGLTDLRRLIYKLVN